MGDAFWDDVLGRVPEETLSVRRAAFRQLLAAGKPVPLSHVASASGLTTETTRAVLDLVESAGMAETDDDLVFGIDGLTTRSTEHGIEIDGVNLWTWCAYDIVGVAAALHADAAGVTACGWCKQTIKVAIHEGKPETSNAVGWLPNESCANVMEQFCPSALFFCSMDHLDRWRAESDRASGDALDLERLASHGAHTWRELVD